MPAADNQEMKGVRLLDFFSGGLSTSWSEAELSTLLNFILKRLEHRRRRRRKKKKKESCGGEKERKERTAKQKAQASTQREICGRLLLVCN